MEQRQQRRLNVVVTPYRIKDGALLHRQYLSIASELLATR
jgi:hypothetical protein